MTFSIARYRCLQLFIEVVISFSNAMLDIFQLVRAT
jgi:hypothetical protein